MASMITINGVEVPAPKRGLELIVATNVNSGRNANGEMIGQKVGRDINKMNDLEWPYLDAETWSKILKQFSSFFAVVKMPNMVNGGFITIKMYPGDRSAKPMWIDTGNGEHGGTSGDRHVLYYTDCKVNIIDCGIIGD